MTDLDDGAAAAYFRRPLQDDRVALIQTEPAHFEALYALARKPALWAQHPQHDRWQLDKFKAFFQAGLDNDLGCFSTVMRTGPETSDHSFCGMTRFYGFDRVARAVRIGFTFIALEHWGTDLNGRVKALMLNHAFEQVERVFFDIGSANFRSQKAVAKLGAVQHSEADGTRVFVLERARYASD